jgi:3-isopropylmalate/(R)-2-methylmalate dehydratase small subunit
VLPVVVTDEFLKNLLETVQRNPSTEVTVDLQNQVIQYGDHSQKFEINAYKRECLINGYDDIDYLLSLNKEIREFDVAH